MIEQIRLCDVALCDEEATTSMKLLGTERHFCEPHAEFYRLTPVERLSARSVMMRAMKKGGRDASSE